MLRLRLRLWLWLRLWLLWMLWLCLRRLLQLLLQLLLLFERGLPIGELWHSVRLWRTEHVGSVHAHNLR